MTIIRNYYKHADFRFLDLLTQTISFPLEDVSERSKIHGFFAYLGGIQFVLYRQQRLTQAPLILLIGNTKYNFNELNVLTNTISRTTLQSEFFLLRHIQIYCDNKIIFEKDYDEIGQMFEWDPTTFIEAEDFDFGLFLENISKNKERCRRLFTNS